MHLYSYTMKLNCFRSEGLEDVGLEGLIERREFKGKYEEEGRRGAKGGAGGGEERLGGGIKQSGGGRQEGNQRFPGDCIEVKFGEAGRHVVATRDIQVCNCLIFLKETFSSLLCQSFMVPTTST